MPIAIELVLLKLRWGLYPLEGQEGELYNNLIFQITWKQTVEHPVFFWRSLITSCLIR